MIVWPFKEFIKIQTDKQKEEDFENIESEVTSQHILITFKALTKKSRAFIRELNSDGK